MDVDVDVDMLELKISRGIFFFFSCFARKFVSVGDCGAGRTRGGIMDTADLVVIRIWKRR